jgi:AcrR family transcriptional regulator
MARSTSAKAEVERAATLLFAAKGVDGVSIGEIASLAGVSQGALYRHYRSKEDLAWGLFSTAYLRTGAELDEIHGVHRDFRTRINAMAAHFCALYDRDPDLFRFMLIAQHNLLPRLGPDQRTPVDAVADTVRDAIRAGEIAPVDAFAATAAILGIVLQTAIFHIYARLKGSLSARAPDITRAAIAAVEALGRGAP